MSYQIRDYAERNVATVDSGITAAEASELVLKKHVGSLVALEIDRPIDVVTQRDLSGIS